ncbi:MAG TPA: response regulator [Candidatus Xenobia bacterium]|nr:response regulator [Candidatus Xenobia bacterium]
MSQTRTALVIDDDPGSRRLLARWLEEMGWAVVEATSGAEALDCALATELDLVLVDIRMPGTIDGLRTAMVLHENERSRRLPILAVSASPQEIFRHRALAAGCAGFVSKPVSFKRLQQEIDRLVPPGKR